MRKMLASLLFSSICVVLGLAAVLCGGNPQWIGPTNPSTVIPGNTVSFQVTLDEPASGSQPVAISVDDSNQFSSLPTTVYVPNGYTSTTFQGTLSTGASGVFTIIATANGEAADCEVVVLEPPKK